MLSYVLSHMRMCAASEFPYFCWSICSRGASMCLPLDGWLTGKGPWFEGCVESPSSLGGGEAAWLEGNLEWGGCVFGNTATVSFSHLVLGVAGDGVCEARGTLRWSRTGPARKLPLSLQGLHQGHVSQAVAAGRGGRQGGPGLWWGGWGGKARVREGRGQQL